MNESGSVGSLKENLSVENRHTLLHYHSNGWRSYEKILKYLKDD